MVAGILVGVLSEHRANCIVLSDGTCVPLANGLVVDQFDLGTSVMITFSRDAGGEMIVHGVARSITAPYFDP
jgi:hypothetical protein